MSRATREYCRHNPPRRLLLITSDRRSLTDSRHATQNSQIEISVEKKGEGGGRTLRLETVIPLSNRRSDPTFVADDTT